MKTVLITGVAGLLGSRLADWIIENKPEYKVVGIDDLSGGFKENVNPKVDFWEVNLIDPNHRIDRCFEENKFDYVFHFAAYAAEGLSPFIRTYNYDNNLKATARVVNECIKHDVKRLIFSSTLAIYGHGYGGIFDESQIPNPIDPYGVAKYASPVRWRRQRRFPVTGARSGRPHSGSPTGFPKSGLNYNASRKNQVARSHRFPPGTPACHQGGYKARPPGRGGDNLLKCAEQCHPCGNAAAASPRGRGWSHKLKKRRADC
jgi:hypothetical protein